MMCRRGLHERKPGSQRCSECQRIRNARNQRRNTKRTVTELRYGVRPASEIPQCETVLERGSWRNLMQLLATLPRSEAIKVSLEGRNFQVETVANAARAVGVRFAYRIRDGYLWIYHAGPPKQS